MTNLIPVGQEWSDIKNIGHVISMGGLIQSLKGDDQQKTAAAVSIMLMGRELGIGPMESLTKIQIILGKPTIPPEMMKARVHKILPTAIFRIKHSDDKKCIYEAARPGDPVKEYSYTIEDATRMGLLGKDNWKKQPDVMLQWRCTSKVARAVFPDCLSGFSYTPEELNPDVKITDDGDVVSEQQQITAPPKTIEVPVENKVPDESPYQPPKKDMRASAISTAPEDHGKFGAPDPNKLATVSQIGWINANTGKDKTYSREEVKSYVKSAYGKDHFHELNRVEYDELRHDITAETLDPELLREIGTKSEIPF